jgi:hypothetical protein
MATNDQVSCRARSRPLASRLRRSARRFRRGRAWCRERASRPSAVCGGVVIAGGFWAGCCSNPRTPTSSGRTKLRGSCETSGVDVGPTGEDRLTKTTFIQRVNTVGGLAPASGCSTFEDLRPQGVRALLRRLLLLQEVSPPLSVVHAGSVSWRKLARIRSDTDSAIANPPSPLVKAGVANRVSLVGARSARGPFGNEEPRRAYRRRVTSVRKPLRQARSRTRLVPPSSPVAGPGSRSK